MKKAISAILVMALLLTALFGGGTAMAATSESRAVNGTTPEKAGSVFAGWYEDAALTTPYKAAPASETAFAKFVDAKALTVKYQITADTNEEKDQTNLRLVTTVDDLQYRQMGFKVEYGTHTGADAVIRTGTKVSETLSGFSGADEFTYTPAEAFDNSDSAFFFAWNFKIPKSMYDTGLTVTAFWDTWDGTRVFGESRLIRISDSENYNNYLIGTAAELLSFATASQTKDYAGWKVKLTADINMNPGWTAGATAPANAWTTPIGSASLPFAGTFDGQGHTISGIYQNAAGTGLFKQTASTAVLKDFRLENSYFVTTDGIAGMIAAKFAGRAERIYNNATLSRSVGNNYFGGFFGQSLSGAVLSECWFDGEMILANGQRDGGFIGAVYGDTTVEHCLFTGTMSGGYAYMGGITGMVGVSGGGTSMTLTVKDTLVAALGTITANSSTGVCSLVGARETGAIEVINFDHTVAISKLARTTAGSFGWTNSEYYTSRDTYADFSGTNPAITLSAFLDFDQYWMRREGGVPILKNLAGFAGYTLDENNKRVYTIHNASEFKEFAATSKSFNFEDCTVKLAADIDLNPGCVADESSMSGSPAQWTQIGSASVPFAGTFDGQGHTISGVYMNTSENRAGLFLKTAESCVLKDFRLENSIFLTTVAYAGSIAGSFAGTAEHIYSNATVRKTTSGNSRFGGFFGNIEGSTATINECWYDGLCSAIGNSYVGGFIGALDTACDVTVSKCLFSGALNGSNQTGGICGNAVASGSNITISETLSASGSLSVSQYGGLVGGRQTASSVLTANDSVCVCSSKWYGNSGAYNGNAVNVSSKTIDQLKGAGGIFLDSWLDFENVWTLREGAVPGLQYFAGDSVSANTMIIETAEGLRDFASATKTYSFTGWTVKLAADIDFNLGCTATATGMSGDPESFAMIGSTGCPFGGTFDGQGHTISGVYVSGTSGVGLFQATSANATIKDLKLTNSLFTTTAAYGGTVACFFAGRMERVFSDSFVYKSTSGNSRFGGLAATVQGGAATFSECWFAGTVKADGNLYVGGLVGGSENSAGAMLFEHCLFTGSMSCGGQGGGIFGYMLAGGIEFNDTLSIGTITTGTASSTGTLFGGRSSATPQLVVRNSAGVGTLNFLGASAADTKENADGVSSRTRDELKGIDGVFLDRFLDFENYWMLQDNDIPTLRAFASSVSALQALVENSEGITASASDLNTLNTVYAGTTLYQGDMHAHADDDGRADETASLAQWKTEMAGHDLDFVASLDHRQTTHIENSEWDKDLFLYGTEPGTYVSELTAPTYSATAGKAHYLMLFKTKAQLENVLNAVSGFNYDASYAGNCTANSGAYEYPNFTKSEFAALANTVKNEGGLFVFAHPYAYEYSTIAEDYFIADGTALEVIYGSMTMKSDSADTATKKAYDLWKELLTAGHRVYATSGSDIHGGLDTQDDHATNPKKAEKALTSVYAVTDTDSTNKADLIMDRLTAGNFAAGSVGIKMCVGNTPMGGTTSFTGKKLIAEVGGFHKYVNNSGHIYRVDVYAGSDVVFSKHMSNTDTLTLAFQADDNAAFYRIVVIDETDNRPISYGNPIWNN